MARNLRSKLAGAMKKFMVQMNDGDRRIFIHKMIESDYGEQPIIIKTAMDDESDSWCEIFTEPSAAYYVMERIDKDARQVVESILMRSCKDKEGVKDSLDSLNEKLKWRKTLKEKREEICEDINSLSVQ